MIPIEPNLYCRDFVYSEPHLKNKLLQFGKVVLDIGLISNQVKVFPHLTHVLLEDNKLNVQFEADTVLLYFCISSMIYLSNKCYLNKLYSA